ncbi:TPA: NYN domain-containing protein [Acinetobacter baumannii]|uniref:NYN domain-containing protein n=1 Tax=Acinetobacter baumannii TaxID=470 RepID=UPI00233EF7B8|nr:NYN domain-containing protein [Acinetobacter baumannii]MDC5547676.1 NYN domain-containing protein [Acinetobacter baumannii]MDO7499050.1 NYN domain-containing protein [Acinetobacter baumannii]HEN9525391.1 NYN domain-containing protein [Acinetobacter baumannii]HEN9533213.1 NYN domain-containing protein [Acinetobacter baumannii]
MKKVAVLVDGGFFISRVFFTARKYFKKHTFTADQLIKIYWSIVNFHCTYKQRDEVEDILYRVYFYDCPPLPETDQKKYPLPEPGSGHMTPKNFNPKVHPPYVLRRQLHIALGQTRKTALRLGKLGKEAEWQLKTDAIKALIKKEITWDQITNDHFFLDIKQKGVDTKIGLDISTLAYEKLVDKIVLVTGDSDFVPAAKLARMKGIEVVLDTLGFKVSDDLSLHVDGSHTYNMVKMIYRALDYQIVPDDADKIPWWNEYLASVNSRKKPAKKRR